MSFSDLLENLGSLHEFESTKNEFRNFWNLVKDTYTADPKQARQYLDVIYGGGQKRYDALKMINKSLNIKNILKQLSPQLLDEMQVTCSQKNQIFQALLETKDIKARHDDLKNYPYILDALNALPPTYSANLLDQVIDPDIWLKISNIQDTGALCPFFQNLAFGEVSYMLSTGFLTLIAESTDTDLSALIDLYQTTHFAIIRIIDQGLNDKQLVIDIHKIFMDNAIPLTNKQALLKGLTGFTMSTPQDTLMWQQKISANLFSPSHTNIIVVLKQLLSIPQSAILMGFLALTVKFGNNGYTQIQFLLQAVLKDNMPHPILAGMNTLKGEDIALMMQELVWTNHGDIFVAQKFLDFTEELSASTLNQLLEAYLESANQTYVLPHLIQSIETAETKIYPYLCDEAGVVYRDLILELQMLDGARRSSILADGSATLFKKLRKLEGLPFLLAGVLQIRSTDDTSEKLQERAMLNFLDTITRQDFQNIADGINAFGNRQLTRIFVPLICLSPLAMKRINCNDAAILLNALCSKDGTIKKRFISGILDNKTITGVVKGLVVPGDNDTRQILSGFINALDSQSTDDTIADQYNAFLLNDDDPYRFVHLIAQMANSPQKSEQYYGILMQKTPADRQKIITDIMVSGKIELIFSAIMQDSEFKQWEDVRQKSEPLYQALLILLSKADDENLKILCNLIQTQLMNTPAYKNILDSLSIQLSYQKIVNFIAEIQSSPNFMNILQEAFHEKIDKEVEAYTRLIVKLYDKGVLIEAFGQLPSEQAILLIRAFASGYENLLDMLHRMNSVSRCSQLLKRFCQETKNDANYPIALCSNMMACFEGATSIAVLQPFVDVKNENEDKMFLDFETVINAVKPGNPEVITHATTLLNQHLFIFITKLFGSEMRQKLLAEILVDTRDPIGTFYLTEPNIMLPLLGVYRKAGDLAKIHALSQKIATTSEWLDTLKYFTHAIKDSDSKLLIALFAVSIPDNCEINMQKIERLKQATEYFPGLREALFRFAARSNIYPVDLFTLIKYLFENDMLYTSNGKINETLGFPQKQMIVSEDHWVYDQFLKAIEFYRKKS